jgi:crotonobetainyl-CoA:carnitine CoA-transferase CaiB-like acyl-CoA transferase
VADTSNRAPLDGVRVVEVASWVMVPSAGAILAANGADVVKVEPSGSADPSRATTFEIDGDVIEPGFELSNSGKRGITLDLRNDAGQEVLHRLLDAADVFLTNVRPAALERAGLVPEQLHARYPRLVIAHGTGYGLEGAETDRPAFDELAYWARGGIGRTLAPEDEPPVQLVGAMGDLPSGVALVAGVMTALFRRERGDGGSIVDVSLLGAGLWTNGWELQQALIGQPRRATQPREARLSPLYNCYRCADGRWVQFAMYQAGRYWRPLCEALGRDDLAQDARFQDFAGILEHAVEAREALEATLGALTLDEIAPLLDAADLPWAPVSSLEEIVNDEQARANGLILSRLHRSGREIDVPAPPFRLRDVPLTLGPAPEVGQHREELLLELGYDWPDIERLASDGAF